MKMKVWKSVGVIFGVIGFGLLIGSYFSYSNARNFLVNSDQTIGTVLRYDSHISESTRDGQTTKTTMYTPLFNYSVNGSDYESKSSISSSSKPYKIGEEVKLLYSKENPNESKEDSFFSIWGASLIMGLIGVIFFSIGSGLTLFALKKSALIKKLKKHGNLINAEIENVFQDTSISINGRHPLVIVAKWIDPNSGEVHSFKSDGTMNNFANLTGASVGVFINPEKKEEYFVDLESIKINLKKSA
jgi:hypothetical protein